MRLIDADELLDEICREQCERKFADCDGMCEMAAVVVNAPTVGGWISVKDRLPEKNVPVLVWEKQGFAYVDMLEAECVWQIASTNYAIVTHWMPLPEPPKEETPDA